MGEWAFGFHSLIAACMQTLRAFVKFARMLWWVVYGYWRIQTVFHKLEPQAHAQAVEEWSQGMLSILGITVRVQGAPSKGPVLMAANHISWLDILVMHAACHCRFVAKSEIRAWPLLGVLTAGGGSLFIERTSSRDAMRVVHQMADALAQGQLLAVFPEGSTGDGKTLLPFHGNLLQAAIVANAPIQPIGLQFLEVHSGEKSFAPCYHADDTLLGSVWRTLCAPPLLAVVHYGSNEMAQGRSRREWAVDLRDSIGKLID
jgi:1-acyl-sn-glycerol-3-phosphate acyltransferase